MRAMFKWAVEEEEECENNPTSLGPQYEIDRASSNTGLHGGLPVWPPGWALPVRYVQPLSPFVGRPLQRIDAVGIALHHHGRGQHHRNRDACEDETYQF
jgi:hypothetical protein